MRVGRRRLPVLAELSAPSGGDKRVRSLRRGEVEAMRGLGEKLGDRRVVLAAGGEALAVAIPLAGAAASAGRRVALVECELDHPRLAAELGLATAPGLREYLRWEASAGEILQPLALAGPASRGATEPLVCIVGGAGPGAAATLVGSESLRHAAAKLSAAYDLVVLIGPALDADRSVLASLAAQADLLLACVAPEQAAARGRRGVSAAVRRLPVEALGTIVVAAAGPQRS